MNQLFWYPGYDLPLKNIVRAENCNLFDAHGKRYVDLESGVWCTAIGHSHPRILRVLTEQAGRIIHTGFSYSNEIVDQAAREVLSLIGFAGGKCVFLCSGSEAVEFGVRVARSVQTRPLLMTMVDSYFGAYGSASMRPEAEWFCFNWMECARCEFDEDCSDRCEHWGGIPFDKIGGFLFEPGSSSGLVRFPPVKLINCIAATMKENGGLVLVNEVTTGFGRTGKWFGYQHYDISPDIVAMGKAIGNGYPVSATAFSPDMIHRLDGQTIKYAQSHQNDPLGAAIAREVIRAIDEDGLVERGRRLSEILLNGLEALRNRTDRIKAIRARGLMVALELNDDATASFSTSVQAVLLQNGYVVAQRPGLNVLRIDPSLTIEDKDIEAFLETLELVLTDVYA